MKKNTISVVIPTYNGLSLLKKHLPDITRYSGRDTTIIVVDDGSIDNTQAWLQAEYPAIVCIHNRQNLGFTKSVNLGVKEAKTDLVLLLNNDVAVTKNYLVSANSWFSDPTVFAVTLNEISGSWPVVVFKGKFNYTRAEDKSKAYYSCWASGGSAVFRTDQWRKLGGFDEVFTPGYWEDIDLGYRAWKSGYSIIWDPDSKVVHEHESTFNKYDRNHLNIIKQRNELIFTWKNITDPDLRREHSKYLFNYCLKHPGYLKIILSAMFNYSKVKPISKTIRTDHQVFQLVNQPVK